MSKPNKPGELRDVTVDAISLVSKAANGERFKVFKSAEDEPEPAPEVVEKDERGLFHTLKEFFTGGSSTNVEKGAVEDTLNAKKAGGRLFEAFDALTKVLGLSRYVDEGSKPETDPTKIVAAVDDFRDVALDILLGKNAIVKSGRKIAGSRLEQLKHMQAILNEVLSGLDDTSEEASEVTKEEVVKAVDEAVQKALTPVFERIEKVEKARGISNRVPEDTAIEKSHNDFWGGIF